MNFNRGLAELRRQYDRLKLVPPYWLLKATELPGDKIICRDRRGGQRVVDRKIWKSLDNAARGRWIDRIAAEQLRPGV